MFSKELIDLIFESGYLKKWYMKLLIASLSILMILYILGLIIGTIIDISFLQIDYTKVKSISTIIASLFGILFFLSILLGTTKGKQKVINKKKILEDIKKIIEEKKISKYFNKFLVENSEDLGYKTISYGKLGDNVRLNITLLDEYGDFGQLSLYINDNDYEKLNKKVKAKFRKAGEAEKERGYPKYSYLYNEKFDKKYETLERQLLDIVEIFGKK